MNKDKEFKVYEVIGNAGYLAVKFAVNFPEEFAQTVARWFPGDMDAIINALVEEDGKLIKKEG